MTNMLLFFITAFFEILGCYLPWLALRQDKSPWLWLPGLASLAIFAWLLTLHPHASGRIYAAYGGVYIFAATLWLVLVDKERLSLADLLGVGLCLAGTAVIYLGNRAD
ncbi:MAG: YnfA family protein [Sumerlaeia bacterium]